MKAESREKIREHRDELEALAESDNQASEVAAYLLSRYGE